MILGISKYGGEHKILPPQRCAIPPIEMSEYGLVPPHSGGEPSQFPKILFPRMCGGDRLPKICEIMGGSGVSFPPILWGGYVPPIVPPIF